MTPDHQQRLHDAVAHIEAAATLLGAVEADTTAADDLHQDVCAGAAQCADLVDALRAHLVERRAVLCAYCDGQGYLHMAEQPCIVCAGKGETYAPGLSPERCDDCDGIGVVALPLTVLDAPHRSTGPGVEPCHDCIRCKRCGKDGCGPGVAWEVAL